MGLFNKKQSIDPVEFLVLRNELVELKERLDASEQAKASLEDRLSSLAATTMVLSSNSKSDTAEIVEKIELLENRLETTLSVGTKVDELHQRVIDVEQGAGNGGGTALEPRLAELSHRLDQVAELAAAPVAPDDELAGRLDALSRSAENVDLLQRQMSQINARMSAQADIADQITALSDRVGLLQQRNVDSDRINQRLDELTAATGTEEISERLALLGQRLTATEEATRAAAEQAATRAEIAEQMAALERRIIETSEQVSLVGQVGPTGQVDDLDQRISALVSPATEMIEARLADVDAQLRAQAALADRLAQLDAQLQDQSMIAQRVADIDERLALLMNSSTSTSATDSSGDAAAIGADLTSLRQLVELRSADVAGLRELIDVRSAEIAEVRDQLAQLSERGPALPPPDVASAGVINPFTQQLGALAERVALTAEDARVARDRAAALEQRIAELDQTTTGRNSAAQANTDEIDRQLAELRERLDQQAQLPDRLAALDRRLSEMPDRSADIQQLQERLGELAASVPDVGGLSAQLEELSTRINANEQDARTALRQALAIDERVQNVSTQLANQLSELSREMDSLATREPAAATVQIDDEALQSLRTGQVKLASEQARYEISFREDLAALAEQVRSLRGRS